MPRGRLPVTTSPRVATSAAAISARAVAVLPGATPAVRSSSTVVSNPSSAESRAVARTQWSVAIPTTCTSSMARSRSQSARPDRRVGLDGVALEPAVGRAVVTLAEDRLHVLEGRLRSRVEQRAVTPDPAVRRPAVHEVRRVAEVRARVVVPVGGGDDHGILPVVGEDVLADPPRHLRATGDGERAALAEVVLDVHDHQRTAHPPTLLRPAPFGNAPPGAGHVGSVRLCAVEGDG